MKFFVKSLVFATCAFATLHASQCTKEATESYQFVGNHFVASYKDCDYNALTNIPKLREAMIQAAKASGAQILSHDEFIFQPNGFTMAILLSESHASIHTYPEFKACFVDLFTCGNRCSSKAFDKVLRNYLKPKKVKKQTLKRK